MLTIERWAAVAMLAIVTACNPPVSEVKKPAGAQPAGPQMQATVVTIRTTTQPGNRTTTSTIVIGPGLARDVDEVGTWRLFDVKNARVAFVNDTAKSFRWQSLQSLDEQNANANRRATPDGTPQPQYALTPVQRPIAGVPARQAVVKLGAYQREMWIGSHPLIPPTLFALIQASQDPGNNALLSAPGFPLAEHVEVPYGKTKLVVDREVVSVARKNVPEAVLQIPASYRDVTVKEPAGRRPAASSRPPDRRTPEGESRSSGTVRKDP